MIPEPQSSRSRQPADRWLFVGLLALLLWLPLPWGSHSQIAVIVAGLAAYSLLAAWFVLAMLGKTRLPGRSRELLVPLALWILWLAWIAIQGMPLSAGLLGTLSPESLRMHQAIAALDAGGRPIYSLSIAPGATWGKWLECWLYFGLYGLCLLMVRSDRRLRLVLFILLIAGLLEAAYGGFMNLSGKNWGWLAKKQFYLESATGTFVNRNHFAGYLELSAAAGLALVLADLGGTSARWNVRALVDQLLDLALSPKIRARVALGVIAFGLVLSRSRMGNFAFFTAVSVGGLAYVLLRERKMFLRALVLFASVLVLDILMLSGKVGLENVIERVESTRLEQEGRLKLLAEIGPVAESYAVTGSGLGTFSLAYEPHRSEAVTEYMNHAHNDYVELFVETGVIGMALLGGLLIWHALHAIRVAFRRRNRLKVAAAFAVLMSMLALGVHASAEFLFQIPAIAGTFVVLLGTAAACSDTSRETPREFRPLESLASRANAQAP